MPLSIKKLSASPLSAASEQHLAVAEQMRGAMVAIQHGC